MKKVTAAALLCLVLAAAPPELSAQAAAPAAPTAPSKGGTLKDRVVAVVDEDPILESDLNRAIALGFSQRRGGEAEGAFRRRALDELIQDRLRFHEVDRFGFEDVPVEDIEERLAKIRASFGSPGEFQKVLRDNGLTTESVRQIVTRQLLVWTYVQERLGPGVFVDAESINRHYRERLVPEMKRLGKTPPPVEDLRQEILEVLQAEKLNQELEKWTEELRRKADIAVYLDNPIGKAPPVVKKLGRAPSRPTNKD